MERICIKDVWVDKKGNTWVFPKWKEEEIEEELQERLGRGERIIKIVWEPFEEYLKHLRRDKINHRIVTCKDELGRPIKGVIVAIDESFKPYRKGLVGVWEEYYKLEDGETLDTVAKKFSS